MVEIVAGGVKKAQAYYANSLAVQVIENYGQLRVTDEKTGRALPKVYVKVYARMKDGAVAVLQGRLHRPARPLRLRLAEHQRTRHRGQVRHAHPVRNRRRRDPRSQSAEAVVTRSSRASC